ncbi:type 2 lanthipeptide synthetase LanM [Streptomyces sp. DSM 40750]|uniref:type 2 lanthipeptide synthetase LanM n=1 Tax=Streptomyces sp. DSM 40750 TaxID=2801030 RepID=UPI00214BA7B6|nr:type 2 lanthipeptide synthetase LanM [Streptomyces sp. DSM 40750]UUU22841.1 type 2 lanthipeptide synthetase LanM [Streptomyces sp. DSM 40750]
MRAPTGDAGQDVPAELPAVARRLIDAVREGTAGGLFPPVVTAGPEGTVTVDRLLGGAADARMLAHALGDRRFAPLLALLDRLDGWCVSAARNYSTVVATGVLDITNAEIFGPVVSEAFVACATGRPHYARDRVAEWAARCEAFLTLFLDRLLRDMNTCWPEDPAFRGPVVGLWAHGEETHNGRQRVVRLDCAGGGRVAYKPRPASGELLFTACGAADSPASLFELLNNAPAASGEIRLPVLSCWSGADQGYLWQEWIEPPAQWGPIRTSGPWSLTGTRLTRREAARYWHRTGSLTSATFAFGITDLIGSNVVTGSRPGEREPLLYPIDLEIYFCRIPRLYDTGLLYDPTAEVDQHHVGLENTPRWCSAEGPPVCWHAEPAGALRLYRRRRPFARDETRNVVADSDGRAGYGPYLTAMLRGMFDAWTLMCRQRPAIRRFLSTATAGHYVRVLRQPTFRYFDALVPRWLSGGGAAPVPAEPDVHFDRAELDQLRRMDVPYFVRSLEGGPVLRVEPPPLPFGTARVAARPEPEGGWPPLPALLEGANLELAGLGVALRDAVEHVFDDVTEHVVTDESLGVRLHLQSPAEGQVGFDWPEVGRRVTYIWNKEKVRLRIDAVDAPDIPAEPAPAGEIRRRLLRLDRLDGALRMPWAEGGMVDGVAERRLRTLTDAGIAWLSEVVADHGWPGRTMVGAAAAAAASRLVQHARDHLDFRRHCLELMRQAAADGDLPWREVASLTDELRLADGLPQVYGTKFEPVAGELVPYRIEEPDDVDRRRASMGMEPLAEYADRIRQRFPLAGREAS